MLDEAGLEKPTLGDSGFDSSLGSIGFDGDLFDVDTSGGDVTPECVVFRSATGADVRFEHAASEAASL